MTDIPLNDATAAIAKRIVWFEPPENSLRDTTRFLAYAFTYALPEDMKIIRTYIDDDRLRAALDNAPPGIIDPRSWAYWQSKLGRYPAPPLPTRRLDP
jgi:hypothetical protein